MNTPTTNSTNTPPNKANILREFKTPRAFYASMILILFLIIALFLIVYKVKDPFKKSKSQEEIVKDVFIILFFTLFICGLCITLLPNLGEFKKLFGQISNVSYVILYTIFLILFFTLTSADTLNKYAYIVVPVTIALGGFIFYKSSTDNYISNFNVNYERIKTMILLFCLIAIFIVYYSVDPGGFIHKYFGYTMLLTIILSIFAFLYLMILLTLRDNSGGTRNLLDNFSAFTSYGSIAFLLFLIIITVIFSTYPGGFFNDKSIAAPSIILVLVICILWGTVLGANLLPETLNNSIANDKMNIFKRSLLTLFGFIVSSLLIYWIVYNVQNLSGKSSIVSLVLNFAIVILVLGLIYKTLFVQLPAGNAKKNAFFAMITNTIFYIPCLFSGAFDSLGKAASGDTTGGSILMLITSIVLLVVYFKTPSVFNNINLQGGKQLVNQPAYTDSQYQLGTYQELNDGSDKYDYQYAISCWIFLDAAGPNTNASYSKYTSLLNFGNKPNILYNGKTNTLMVTMEQKDLHKTTNSAKLIDFDENGNRILYKNENMLLQKWNNIIINYSGGVLDIFLNGELVKSDIGVVPYYTLDNLTIGEEDGIKGGICNVVYFRRALQTHNIYYLYNSVKNQSPPLLNHSNETVVKQTL